MKALTALALALFTLVACNTVQGVGKDVEAGGEAIQDGAEKVRKSF